MIVKSKEDIVIKQSFQIFTISIRDGFLRNKNTHA